MKHVHILRIGIATYEEVKERTLAIARGDYKPTALDPKVWFSSMESFAQVLSSKNKMLLEIISKEKPNSVTELAQLSGRQKSNLSRTLKTMERYGLVELIRQNTGEIQPLVTFDYLRMDMHISPEPPSILQ